MAKSEPAGDILVVGPSWVGDMVMAQTLFKCLKQNAPERAIDVLAPAWSEPLLERMPEVRKGLSMPLGHGQLGLAARRNLGRSLADKGYGQAILLPNSLKSALVPFFAGIPLRTGWRGEMRYVLLNDLRKLNKDRYPLMIERFAALAWPDAAELPLSLPRPALLCDETVARKRVKERGISRDFIALCPGAEFGPAKRWPEQHYAEVAKAMLAQGYAVVLFGSAKDRPVAQSIIDALPAGEQLHNLCGETALGEAIDLMSKASAVVCNDSGLMHIAAALQRPLVVVYGSTSPQFTPPLADQVAIEQLEIECSPCFQRECPLGHLRCLKDLKPQRVIASLQQMLAII